MTNSHLSRRAFSSSIVAATAGLWAALASDHGSFDHQERRGLTFLTPDEAAELEAIAARIIPSDDGPGAREARVVQFIDRGLTTFSSELQDVFRNGLVQLRADVAKQRFGTRTFASLTAGDQVALLQSLEKAKSPFFDAVRTAVVTGFVADPKYGGNYQKAGWKTIGFDDRFSWQAPFGYYDRPDGTARE